MRKLLIGIVAVVLLLGATNTLHASTAGASNLAIPPEFQSVSIFSEGLAAVKKDDKWGYINKSGVLVVSNQYDEVGTFFGGVAKVKLNNQWGLINQAGKVIVTPQYESIDNFINGLAKVGKDKKYGYINKAGNVVIKLVYNKIYGFSEGLARFERDGKDGFVNEAGVEVLPPQYVRRELFGAYNFEEGLAPVIDVTATEPYWFKLKFIDKQGFEVIAPHYESTSGFSEGLASVCIRVNHIDQCGYINKYGEEIVPLIYRYTGSFSEGMGLVSKQVPNRNLYYYGFVNKSGQEVTAIEYDEAFYFQEGLAAVVKDNKLGFINKNGRIVIPLNYDYDRDDRNNYYFKDGLVKVSLDGKYGYIDVHGKEVIKVQYSSLGEFSDNLVLARDDNRNDVYLDRSGQTVIRSKYWEIHRFSEGLAGVNVGGKWGFIAKPTKQTATPTSSNVMLNGKKVNLEAYNIKGNNYFKLRDIAMLLNDTEKQYSIKWDADINGIALTSGEEYTPAGGELTRSTKMSNKSANPSVSIIYLNGQEIELTAYNIDGSNYFKLADLGTAINFEVGWNATTKTVSIDTTKPAKK